MPGLPVGLLLVLVNRPLRALQLLAEMQKTRWPVPTLLLVSWSVPTTCVIRVSRPLTEAPGNVTLFGTVPNVFLALTCLPTVVLSASVWLERLWNLCAKVRGQALVSRVLRPVWWMPVRPAADAVEQPPSIGVGASVSADRWHGRTGRVGPFRAWLMRKCARFETATYGGSFERSPRVLI